MFYYNINNFKLNLKVSKINILCELSQNCRKHKFETKHIY